MIYLKEAWYLFSVKEASSRLLLVVAMQCATDFAASASITVGMHFIVVA